jgi:hypothetical protein
MPMLKRASNKLHHRTLPKGMMFGTAATVLGASLACLALAAPAFAQDGVKATIPDLASSEFAWLAQGVRWIDPPRGLGRGPIRQDPAHPFHGNQSGPGQVTHDIGNTKDSILKPWAAKQMEDSNNEVLTGKRGLGFTAQGSCYPGGVPGQLLFPASRSTSSRPPRWCG